MLLIIILKKLTYRIKRLYWPEILILMPETYKKDRLSKGLITMNFKQFVTETTRSVSDTCLDHILTNNPQRIHNIVIPDIGLSDHLPVFAVRQYSRNSERVRQQKGLKCYIKYRNMKGFNEEQFKCSYTQRKRR